MEFVAAVCCGFVDGEGDDVVFEGAVFWVEDADAGDLSITKTKISCFID